jgi:outer membrane protein W
MHLTQPMYTKSLVFFTLCAVSACAQDRWVTFGVKGGVSITEPGSSSFTETNDSRRYLIGPTVEFRLPSNFAVEVSALYQRLGSTEQFQFANTLPLASILFNHRRADSWQFPLLGKYYFNAKTRGFQPFIGTGFAIRTAWAEDEGVVKTTNPQGEPVNTPYKGDFRLPTNVGAVAAAGARLKTGRFALTPEFR